MSKNVKVILGVNGRKEERAMESKELEKLIKNIYEIVQDNHEKLLELEELMFCLKRDNGTYIDLHEFNIDDPDDDLDCELDYWM